MMVKHADDTVTHEELRQYQSDLRSLAYVIRELERIRPIHPRRLLDERLTRALRRVGQLAEGQDEQGHWEPPAGTNPVVRG